MERLKTSRARWLGVGLTALTLLCTTKVRVNGFTLPEWWRDLHTGVVLSHAQTDKKVVALTFDDGPEPRYTPRILEILARYSVKATFFEEGQQMDRCPELTRTVLAQGHCLGNHTYTHPYLTRLSARSIHTEFATAESALERDAHVTTALFRPPRGDWNPMVYKEAQKQHDRIILWSVALEHHDTPAPQQMAERMLRQVRPGSILLLHDGGNVSRETTVQALPLLLEGLRRRGYTCVTVPELLHIPGNTRLPAPTAH